MAATIEQPARKRTSAARNAVLALSSDTAAALVSASASASASASSASPLDCASSGAAASASSTAAGAATRKAIRTAAAATPMDDIAAASATRPPVARAGRALATASPKARTAVGNTRLINRLLRDVFDVDALRDGQRPVIDSVLDGRDTLAIMPTGSGKSLCYQIPAALLEGTTLVVSPLISLMKDQLQKLTDIGIPAIQVNSSLSREEENEALAAIASGQPKIVFCTPERLTTPEFLQVVQTIKVPLIVIDEAHCISRWGHDFRPAYLELASAIRALGRPPLLALTATATSEVVADIGTQLGATKMNVVNTGIYRANLGYSVIQTTNAEEKIGAVLKLVRDTQGVGIVYAATVKAAEELHARLLETGESVVLYHGKLPARERKENQDLFMTGERRVMVATNAFGMGIDKSDTRFVIHLQVPANLEAYYQESGRAGRDGLPAHCTLLYFQDDKRLQQFFLSKNYPAAGELQVVFDVAMELAAEQGAFSFDDVKNKFEDFPSSKLKICLKLLKDGRLLRQDRKLDYLLKTTAPGPDLFSTLAQGYVDKQERDRAALEQMVSYAQSGFCRWKLLLDYFGQDAGFERCCNCDNCLSPPAVGDVEGYAADLPVVAANVELVAGHEEPLFRVGDQVRVPKFDVGTVVAVEGEQIGIEFPGEGTRTFMAAYVEALLS